jgi:magnesium chelatase family protein
MGVARANSFAFAGIEAHPVEVQVQVASGLPNFLMISPPGGGKSMLAARLPGLLPDLTPREALEVSMVHSVAGMLEGGRLVTRPPFRELHHSASMAAITGGGARARPGEVSLAHRGLLFMDEMPEFPRATLEAGQTTGSRAAAHITYPARFQLIGAMNPCRCGYPGDAPRECGRAPRCGEDYRTKLSGPLLDRIDLIVEITPLSPKELTWVPPGEDSATVAARERQRTRYGEDGATTNAEAPGDFLRLNGGQSVSGNGRDETAALRQGFYPRHAGRPHDRRSRRAGGGAAEPYRRGSGLPAPHAGRGKVAAF